LSLAGVPQEVEGQEIGQVETEEPLSEDEPFESTSKKPGCSIHSKLFRFLNL